MNVPASLQQALKKTRLVDLWSTGWLEATLPEDFTKIFTLDRLYREGSLHQDLDLDLLAFVLTNNSLDFWLWSYLLGKSVIYDREFPSTLMRPVSWDYLPLRSYD